MTVYLCASTYTNYKTKYEFCSEINYPTRVHAGTERDVVVDFTHFYTSPPPGVKASDLQIGQTFFTSNHFLKHSA